MSTLLYDIETTLKTEKRSYRLRKAFFQESRGDLEQLLNEVDLTKASSARMDVDTEDINLYVSGATDTIKEIFRAFRKLGYEPSNRPEAKPQSSFTCYFRQLDKPTFYLSFSSTLCKRVKVGTKTQEVDVYEIVCE